MQGLIDVQVGQRDLVAAVRSMLPWVGLVRVRTHHWLALTLGMSVLALQPLPESSKICSWVATVEAMVPVVLPSPAVTPG